MKGQIRAEFIFGVVVFAVLMFMIISQTNTIFTSVGTDSMADSAKTKAISFLDMILKDSGDPLNWELTNPFNINILGLAYNNQPYNLSMTKINKLNGNRTLEGRCLLLEDFGLGGYRLSIYKKGVLITQCGILAVSPRLVTVTRPVFIEDEYGKVTLEVW